MGFSLSLRSGWSKGLVIACLIAFTLSLHYMWLPFPHGIHLLHRRLCYIPIILGSLWFGLRGGLVAAATISLAVLPLALKHAGPLWGNEELVEIAFYLAIGLLAGGLVDARERERGRKERLQWELAASERLAALGRASAGIAHEVRTPLGSIQGAAEILGEDFPPEHPRRPFYEILLRECRRLAKVVDDFLDLGRPVTLRPGPLRAGDLLRRTEEAVRLFAQEQGVALEVKDLSGDAGFTADGDRLTQALVNMVRNGLQSAPEGGTVALSCRTAGDLLLLEVQDSGPGIPPGREEQIFEPFFTGRRDGTGLGLPLARQIAVAHGGFLTGVSAPGGGALFRLTLPRRAEVAE